MAEQAQTVARRRLALNARRVREQLGMTQEAAAERIGCAVQPLQRMERATAAVTTDFLARVAAAYKIDIGELFAITTGPWKPPRPGRPPSPTGLTGTPKRKRGRR